MLAALSILSCAFTWPSLPRVNNDMCVCVNADPFRFLFFLSLFFF
jgi:hypothetical protein